MEKKKPILQPLLAYAGKRKVLTYLSMVISGISQLLALVPFLYIWAILRDVIAGDYSRIAHYGWMAVAFAIATIVVYFGALMCSHLAAFRIAANMRKALMRHIMTLPIGFLDALGSGKVCKWVQESTQSTETYLAHQLPDKAGMYATMIGLAVLMFLFDWRMGLLCLGTVVLAIIVMVTPAIAVTLNRIMFASENEMIVAEALDKTGRILSIDPLPDPSDANLPDDNDIQLKDVRFRYPEAERFAVDGVSLDIKPGQKIAFVGPSGGGKTTTASLIARFFDVTEGTITLGGVDIRHIRKKDLMDRISFVFQDSRLLKTSIFENVRLGRPDASREEVLEALHKAQCDDILAKLPDGIDTVIGTQGTYLSGGEQQRVAIARAFLKDAPIILMDEATASLDVENETFIQESLSRLVKDKTVIIIAHRMRTVAGADKIVVLKEGKVEECGTPAELTASGGFYKRMQDIQQGALEWNI